MKPAPLLTLALALLLLAACEKMNISDYLSPADTTNATEVTVNGDCKVTFCVENYTLTDFDDAATYSADNTKAVVPVSELGTRLSVGLYQNDSRLTYINQESSDSDFGTVTFNLAEGSYEVAIIVHSCDGNPTMTDPTKISWSPMRVTDTFTWYEPIDVAADTTYTITLTRRVAMYRFTITDEIPDEVADMYFYYTGGSSTINIKTGFGSVDSHQSEYRDVTSHDAGQTFDLYTFPHDKEDVLKMTITARDSAAAEVHKEVYEGIPVEINKITTHTTNFFTGSSGGGTGSGVQYSLHGDNAWSGTLNY